MRTIRASDIAVYTFCARAWWYRITGVPAENNRELVEGSAFHEKHGSRVVMARLQGTAGWALLLLALILLTVALTIQWMD